MQVKYGGFWGVSGWCLRVSGSVWMVSECVRQMSGVCGCLRNWNQLNKYHDDQILLFLPVAACRPNMGVSDGCLDGVWQCQDGVWVCLAGVWGVWMSYKLKTVGQESLYKSVSFSPSDLLEPKRTKMAILDFSPCPGVFSGLGGWFLFQMASFGPLQSPGGVASSNFEFTHLSIHAICGWTF